MLMEVCPNLNSAKLTSYHMDYLTGHHKRHSDGPDTAGCISIDFHPAKQDLEPVIPVSTVRTYSNYVISLVKSLTPRITEYQSVIYR